MKWWTLYTYFKKYLFLISYLHFVKKNPEVLTMVTRLPYKNIAVQNMKMFSLLITCTAVRSCTHFTLSAIARSTWRHYVIMMTSRYNIQFLNITLVFLWRVNKTKSPIIIVKNMTERFFLYFVVNWQSSENCLLQADMNVDYSTWLIVQL